MPLIFQYGSNATLSRLIGPRRLSGHVEDRGRACTIEEYDIAFDVWSQTNACAASDLIPTPGRHAWGVLYEIPEDFIRGRRKDGQKTLAEIEGKRYEEKTIRVRTADGRELDAITFLVKEKERRPNQATSAAYVSWIVYGLRDHGVPEDYIAHVQEAAVEANRRASEADKEQIRLIETL